MFQLNVKMHLGNTGGVFRTNHWVVKLPSWFFSCRLILKVTYSLENQIEPKERHFNLPSNAKPLQRFTVNLKITTLTLVEGPFSSIIVAIAFLHFIFRGSDFSDGPAQPEPISALFFKINHTMTISTVTVVHTFILFIYFINAKDPLTFLWAHLHDDLHYEVIKRRSHHSQAFILQKELRNWMGKPVLVSNLSITFLGNSN